jgi:hypothetical protein
MIGPRWRDSGRQRTASVNVRSAGRCPMPTESISSAEIMMLFCKAGFAASPSGNPNGRSTNSARGGATRPVISASSVIDTVGIPVFSMML